MTRLSEYISTTTGEKIETVNKLFGLNWDTSKDSLFTNDLVLDKSARTKRSILKTIAENFDIFGFNLPLMNRARLFMQGLQCDRSLDWDTNISTELFREWKNICFQVNSTPTFKINRFIGPRGESYNLYAFTDSSKQILGVVIFIVNDKTKEMSFLMAKNRLISKNLESKSIPSLELQGITFGVEQLMDTYQELSGQSCVVPMQINELKLFSDSLVCISWLKSHSITFDKLNKLSVFVKNRLNKIAKLCETKSVTFEFCAGNQNPADAVSRPFSHKRLHKTNYYTGLSPSTLQEMKLSDNISFAVPNPSLVTEYNTELHQAAVEVKQSDLDGYDIERSNSYSKVVNVTYNILKYINALIIRIKTGMPSKFSNTKVYSNEELRDRALIHIIKRDQELHFPDCTQFFLSESKALNKIPLIVTQLNVFKDEFSVLRVKSKFKRWKDHTGELPILLSKNSYLSKLIIRQIHERLNHAGYYSVLGELRKKFWVPCAFSTVKSCIRKCVSCRRFNNRTVKLNQNVYRDFRLDPSNILFRDVFIDYLGPMLVYEGKVKVKRYVLLFTCLWSRAINLEICTDLSLKCFLRAFQLQIFSHGTPSRVYSDLGSQITAGAKIIEDFLKDTASRLLFKENNVAPLSFYQYSKGCNKLGGLVESCVKLVKRLISGSVRNLILPREDFVFLIRQVNHLVNRRPVAFKESMRDSNNSEELPFPITPEILLHGHELVSINVVPCLQESSDVDWDMDPASRINDSYGKLLKARKYLNTLYNEEFLPQLMSQATNEKGKYIPVKHKVISVGDIVLLKEPLLKPTNFPMGIIVKTITNSLDEVTSVDIRKGSTREVVRRHVESIIPLLSINEYPRAEKKVEEGSCDKHVDKPIARSLKRKAASKCEQRLKDLADKDMI